KYRINSMHYFIVSRRWRHTRSNRDWSSDVCSSISDGDRADHDDGTDDGHDHAGDAKTSSRRRCFGHSVSSHVNGHGTSSPGVPRSEERRVGKNVDPKKERHCRKIIVHNTHSATEAT